MIQAVCPGEASGGDLGEVRRVLQQEEHHHVWRHRTQLPHEPSERPEGALTLLLPLGLLDFCLKIKSWFISLKTRFSISINTSGLKGIDFFQIVVFIKWMQTNVIFVPLGIAARRVVSLSGCYFLQKPFPLRGYMGVEVVKWVRSLPIHPN